MTRSTLESHANGVLLVTSVKNENIININIKQKRSKYRYLGDTKNNISRFAKGSNVVESSW